MRPLLSLLVGAFNMVAQPWVLQQGWNWHIAPAFSIPRMTYGVAFAAFVLIGLCTLQHIPRSDDERDDLVAFETAMTLAVYVALLLIQ